MVKCPGWAVAMLQNGLPRFANIQPYAGANAEPQRHHRFARKEMGGAFSWDEVARYRDRWKRPLVVKGILHPADAEKAVALGIDGILVSNHGGRQIEALPASIDCCRRSSARSAAARPCCSTPACAAAPTWRARSRSARTRRFAGKAFLWGLGALGAEGPGHVIDLLIDELQSALGQIGAHPPAEARSVVIRHPGALAFPALAVDPAVGPDSTEWPCRSARSWLRSPARADSCENRGFAGNFQRCVAGCFLAISARLSRSVTTRLAYRAAFEPGGGRCPAGSIEPGEIP